jgi:glycosyltransferase involved in cell wall biosynthesis
MAKIFCFPSYAESFGLPPLEAMASGVPIVVSNTTSLPEICGDAGVYINPGNPKEIAEAIDELLANDQFYEEQKRRGLMQAKKFTWHRAAQVVVAGLTTCVKRS